jgi:hypothetical protein
MSCSIRKAIIVDRSIIHDGRKTMYTLSIKGKRIILAPMKEKVKIKIEKDKSLLSSSQFMKEIEGEQVVYTLVSISGTIRKDNDVDDSIEEVNDVLIEFVDMLLEELS